MLHFRDGAQVGVAVDLAVAFPFERGLFGIALHPQFQTRPYVYLYDTASNTGSHTSEQNGALSNRVVRLRWNGATLDSMQVLLTLPVGVGSTLADHVADTAAERDVHRWGWDLGVITDLETGPDGTLYVRRFSSPSTLDPSLPARTSPRDAFPPRAGASGRRIRYRWWGRSDRRS